MTLNRGDVALTRFPHAGGSRGKKRPVVVVQADNYNSKLRHAIVAEVTTNLAAGNDPASLLIDISTPEGQATGLTRNSVVSGLFLATLAEEHLGTAVGKLSPSLMRKLNDCLSAAMALP
ncbi:MAG TPA: type II toxin-antitoxin system PemK/MazF family toxin [Pirellulales bacterium]|nr:type II toxin-antitoxin system PemK/MazF family toxin [Pirellulales bacterium]